MTRLLGNPVGSPVTEKPVSQDRPTNKLYIPKDIGEGLRRLCADRALEWTLFGKTEEYEDGIRLVDFKVPKQTNSGAHTEMTENAMQEILEEILNSDDNPKAWNMWIHSHNKMGAFFSGTDTGQMDSFGAYGVDVMYSLVISSQKEKEILCWVNFYYPLRINIQMEVIFEDESVREVESPVMTEIRELEARLAALRADCEDSGEKWFTDLNAALELKSEKPVYTPYYYEGGNRKFWDDDFGERNILGLLYDEKKWQQLKGIIGIKDTLMEYDSSHLIGTHVWTNKLGKKERKQFNKFCNYLYSTDLEIGEIKTLLTRFSVHSSREVFVDFIELFAATNRKYAEKIKTFYSLFNS